MKNIDVPMWDKGDSTDNFSKGGSSSSSFFSDSTSEKLENIKKIFQLVLGREPSSRENSFYKYSAMEESKIVNKLLSGEEHKEILRKASEHQSLTERNKLAENSILKLKSHIKDKEEEFQELKNLLDQKNLTIEELRDKKELPYLTNRDLLEESKVNLVVSENTYYSVPHKKEIVQKETFLEKLIRVFFEK
ncbi:hypothetical protein GYA44_00335 [Candidatus Microgenomates bacterium]|jgi:hypothetical protein|nr:hypothetical protein [Candidatus Microgenomates bacterium]